MGINKTKRRGILTSLAWTSFNSIHPRRINRLLGEIKRNLEVFLTISVYQTVRVRSDQNEPHNRVRTLRVRSEYSYGLEHKPLTDNCSRGKLM